MFRKNLITASLIAGVLLAASPVATAEGETEDTGIVLFNFEEDLQGWSIPDWAKESKDYSGEQLVVSPDQASSGTQAASVKVNFPGRGWKGAYVERVMDVTDFTPYGTLLADIYVPKSAPKDLQARFILTVGEDWTWTEMNKGYTLSPGDWTTVKVNLKAGSQDWKFFPDESFRKDIRKVGIRVESEKSSYEGKAYVDNVRLAM